MRETAEAVLAVPSRNAALKRRVNDRFAHHDVPKRKSRKKWVWRAGRVFG